MNTRKADRHDVEGDEKPFFTWQIDLDLVRLSGDEEHQARFVLNEFQHALAEQLGELIKRGQDQAGAIRLEVSYGPLDLPHSFGAA